MLRRCVVLLAKGSVQPFSFRKQSGSGRFSSNCILPCACTVAIGLLLQAAVPRQGFHSKAQGCPACRATLGHGSYKPSNPERVAQDRPGWPCPVEPLQGSAIRIIRTQVHLYRFTPEAGDFIHVLIAAPEDIVVICLSGRGCRPF